MASAQGEFVKGFKILRVPVAAGSLVTRTLLVKRHAAKQAAAQDGSDDRTSLFVTHLDNFVSEEQLTRAFSKAFGPIEKVELTSSSKNAIRAVLRADHVRLHTNFARVVFKDAASLDKALQAATGRICSDLILPLPGSVLKDQLKVDKALYREPTQLRQEIDDWMASYDAREYERRKAERENLVDDDGFVKVISGTTRGTDGTKIKSAKSKKPKAGAFAEPIAGPKLNSADTKRKRKRKDKERSDFYRFQQREKRREEILDHRRRKAEDEAKVERMRKKTKRFKAAAKAAE